jgi:hypothetical protein
MIKLIVFCCVVVICQAHLLRLVYPNLMTDSQEHILRTALQETEPKRNRFNQSSLGSLGRFHFCPVLTQDDVSAFILQMQQFSLLLFALLAS